MLGVIIKISTIFVMIFLGYITCKLKVLQSEAQAHLIKLILNINIPCMLLVSVSQNTITEDTFQATIQMFAFSAIYFVVSSLCAIVLVKTFRIKDPDDVGVYKIIFTSINTGFIGFPVTMVLFGNKMLYFMVLHNIVLNLYLYSMCFIQLSAEPIRFRSILQMLKKMINPCIISAIVGIILLFAGLHLPTYLKSIAQPIGDATIPVAMIVIGIQLADGKLRECFGNKKLLLFSIFTMLIWPVIILLLVDLLPISGTVKIILALGAAFPPASTISALAAEEGRNYKLAADGIVVTTLLSIVTIPIMGMLIERML